MSDKKMDEAQRKSKALGEIKVIWYGFRDKCDKRSFLENENLHTCLLMGSLYNVCDLFRDCPYFDGEI